MPRVKSYDQQLLLRDAMEAFWKCGYWRTSVGDLVASSGVNRASLYAAYPDKRELFLASVSFYLESRTRESIAELEQRQPAARAVRSFFRRLTDDRVKMKRGCLLTNSAVEFGVSDEQVAKLLRTAFARVEQALALRLSEIAAAGDLGCGMQPRTYARQLVTFLQGLRVMARAGASKKMLREAIDSALSPIP